MKSLNFMIAKDVKDKVIELGSTFKKTVAKEGARRETGVATEGIAEAAPSFLPPNPEVTEKKTRRKYSEKYKLKILNETDSCTEPGDIGKILRREGLYSSHLTCWRRQRKSGILYGISPKKRGRKKQKKNPLADEVAKLQKENKRLKAKLNQAEIIIDAQKKISKILELEEQKG